MAPPGPMLPRYGERSLAELTPSLMAALGVEGFERNPLGIEPLDGVCVLLVDGLGSEQLRAHAAYAPFLSAAAAEREPLTAGFPATTATSIGSLGTGLPPGEHGLVGYTFAVPGHDDRPMNALQWELYGTGPHVDLSDELPPGRFQPSPTVLELAEQAGLASVRVGPPDIERSPLSRAVLRGAKYAGAYSMGDLAGTAAGLLAAPGGPRLVSAYHPALDTTGHVRGVDSEPWRLELANVDRLAQAIAERLPPRTALIVTGDHGMVDVSEEARLELAEIPELAAGVRMLGGEGRARHVYAVEGASDDVLAAWNELLGDRMWVRSREEAIEEGWFGPVVVVGFRDRIGNVVAAAREPVGVFERARDPLQAMLNGHHGSLTPAEQLVPFVLVRA